MSLLLQNEHFDKSIDDKTGYESRDLLCYPLVLVNEDNKVVGVVEVLNKKTKEPFTDDDLKVKSMRGLYSDSLGGEGTAQ